jgi:hypothetical protein
LLPGVSGDAPTLREDGDRIVILDQTLLPGQTHFVVLRSLDDAAHAIRVMQVRGAPLIGATAAYGVALGLAEDASDARLQLVIETLAATRPTAVNLHWALARMRRLLQESALATRRERAWDRGRRQGGERRDRQARPAPDRTHPRCEAPRKSFPSAGRADFIASPARRWRSGGGAHQRWH